MPNPPGESCASCFFAITAMFRRSVTAADGTLTFQDYSALGCSYASPTARSTTYNAQANSSEVDPAYWCGDFSFDGGKKYKLDPNESVAVALGQAWTPFTPLFLPQSGAFTSTFLSGRYLLVGKLFFFQTETDIHLNGTAAGKLQVTLPLFTVSINPVSWTALAVTRLDTGFDARSAACGLMPSSGNAFTIDGGPGGAYVGGDGINLYTSGVIEIA